MVENSLVKNQKVNKFVLVESIICVLIIYFTCTLKSDLASRVFTFSFIWLLLYFFMDIINSNWHISQSYLFAIVIGIVSFLFLLLSTTGTNESISFSYLTEYFLFMSTIVFTALAEKITINRKSFNFIFVSNLIISGIYTYTYVKFPQAYSAVSTNALYLNFTNPNLAGMFLFLNILYMILAFIYYKRKLVKIIFLVGAILDFDLLLKTESRNVLLALALFAPLVGIVFMGKIRRFKKWFSFIINITPIVFVSLYLTFINVIIEGGWLDFLVSKGKDLNSRVEVWNTLIEKIEGKWLIGNYAEASGNAHNSHMVLLGSFGIIVLIMVIFFTNRVVVNISEKGETKFQAYCMAAYFSVIFMGFGEGSLYSGGLCVYILSGIILIMANSPIDQNWQE